MRKFTYVKSIPAPLNEDNIDTDAILPARFLLRIEKSGFGKYLFSERRRDPKFVLNDPVYKDSQILIAGSRFGIGSSREHAVWALADFGICSIIASSFGDILLANCVKNGILPIRLEKEQHAKILEAAKNKSVVKIDLGTQFISFDENEIKFDVDPYHKRTLMLGLDDIQSILAQDAADIIAFEANQKRSQPWLYLSPQQLSIIQTEKIRS